MKKAQTEMMGLVILVLIITVTAVFGVRFLFSSKESVGPEMKLDIQAANLKNSLLKLDVGSKSVSDLAVECCDTGNCDFFTNTMPKLIEGVLPSQEYEIELPGGINSKRCFKTTKYTCSQRVSQPGRIEKEGGSYNFILSLCL